MKLTRGRKKVLLMLNDLACVILSTGIANLLLTIYIDLSWSFYLLTIGIYFITYALVSIVFHNFSKIVRFFNMRDMRNILLANAISGVVALIAGVAVFNQTSMRFIFLLTIFSVGLMALARLAWRTYIEQQQRREYSKTGEEPRILIVGAGRGGSIFIKSFNEQPNHFNIVGIIDNDPDKQNSYLEGIPVVGTTQDIPELVKQYAVEMITITAPSMVPEDIEAIIDLANEADVAINQMPEVERSLSGYKIIDPIQSPQKIDIADLLGRAEVKLDDTVPLTQINGKKILVTGAGGSIGSEICRQIIKFAPSTIYLLGHGENSIYLINQELRKLDLPDTQIVPLIADVQDREHIEWIMNEYRPDIVYHAAAHKHVPLMEANPTESVKNNVFGTRNVAEAAKAAEVGVFVMVSTDKANNPPNVMGATKRIAEMIVTGMNAEDDSKEGTIFTAVRFGNVLGSRGSVIPVFKRQIEAGGPVTVTDFRMTRFFMTIPEASRLVIQAGALAKGGELFVLDMGKEVKIVDLAKKMIKLSGYTEDEIEIIESGIRPGEKLYEELLLDDETTGQKVDNKIFVGKVHNKSRQEIDEFIQSLDLSGESHNLNKELVDWVHRDAKQEI